MTLEQCSKIQIKTVPDPIHDCIFTLDGQQIVPYFSYNMIPDMCGPYTSCTTIKFDENIKNIMKMFTHAMMSKQSEIQISHTYSDSLNCCRIYQTK